MQALRELPRCPLNLVPVPRGREGPKTRQATTGGVGGGWNKKETWGAWVAPSVQDLSSLRS